VPVAVHPGGIDTGPVTDGAAHIPHAADPAGEFVNGAYYEGLLAGEPAPAARDAAAALRLWRAAARLLGWDYPLNRVDLERRPDRYAFPGRDQPRPLERRQRHT
jgi:hypothetical protein